jgi:hypothetical protein
MPNPEEFSDLVEWGVPLTTVDDYTRHCLERYDAEDSFDLFGIGDSPFAEDPEMVKAASVALLTLRGNKDLTSRQLTQLCWLEQSLMQWVPMVLYGHPYREESVRQYLGPLSDLVNSRQIKLAYEINARDQMDSLDIAEKIANNTPVVRAEARAMRDKVLTHLAARTVVREAFGPVLEEVAVLRQDQLRSDRLEYLRSIGGQ